MNWNTSNYQQGRQINVLFDENVNTETFYENNYFPIMEDDLSDLIPSMRDSIENADYYGTWNDDENWYVCTKNGVIYDLSRMTKAEIGRRIKRPYEKNLLFVVWDNPVETRFWFNGEEGLQALQEWTGWFDMTLYEDTWL